MAFRHSKVLDGVSFEVELDEHGWFVADDSAIVSWFDGDDLRRDVIAFAPILEFDLHVPVSQESDVCVHAELGAGDRLHVLRPVESSRIDHALDAPATYTRDVHLDVSKIFALSILHRCKQRIGARHWLPPQQLE